MKKNSGLKKKKTALSSSSSFSSSDSSSDFNHDTSSSEVEIVEKKSKSTKNITNSNTNHASSTSPSKKASHLLQYHYFTQDEIALVRQRLLSHYHSQQRIFPWRVPSEKFSETNAEAKSLREKLLSPTVDRAYYVWVSEIMLQQTTTVTVASYFTKWMQTFPTIESLSKATTEWAGLGYYRRAKFLHQCAQKVTDEHNGSLPKTSKQLLKLPGIGRYTAGAIASIAFNERTPIVDGNVIRVLSRLRAIGGEIQQKKTVDLIWELSDAIVCPKEPGDFNQALMDYGATICTPKNPKCSECLFADICLAFREENENKKLTKEKEKEGEMVVEENSSKNNKRCDVCDSGRDIEDIVEGVCKYPYKAPKKKSKELHTAVCIIEKDGESGKEYLLIQRPKDGLLASFWEFPSVDAAEAFTPKKIVPAVLKFANQTIGAELCVLKQETLGNVTHTFTHIDQTLHLAFVEVDAEFEAKKSKKIKEGRPFKWCSKEEFLSMAISEGTKKCWRQKEQPNGKRKAVPKSSVKETKEKPKTKKATEKKVSKIPTAAKKAKPDHDNSSPKSQPEPQSKRKISTGSTALLTSFFPSIRKQDTAQMPIDLEKSQETMSVEVVGEEAL